MSCWLGWGSSGPGRVCSLHRAGVGCIVGGLGTLSVGGMCLWGRASIFVVLLVIEACLWGQVSMFALLCPGCSPVCVTPCHLLLSGHPLRPCHGRPEHVCSGWLSTCHPGCPFTC